MGAKLFRLTAESPQVSAALENPGNCNEGGKRFPEIVKNYALLATGNFLKYKPELLVEWNGPFVVYTCLTWTYFRLLDTAGIS